MTRNFAIVDADAHVNPPPDFWRDYLPSQFRELAPRVESGEDADYVVFEGKRKKINILGAAAGRANEERRPHGRTSDMRAGGGEAHARLADMDLDGVDASVIYGGGPLGTNNLELYLASFEAYNRWIADFCSTNPKRLAGIAYLPMHGDLEHTIALMRRMAKLGLKGVNIPAFPQSAASLTSGIGIGMQILALTGDPNGALQYDDPCFDPFWEACIELGMSVNVHLGARSARLDPPRHLLPDLLMTKLTMAEPMAIMVFGGVFQRHPALKFVTVESGVGWFAFAAEYMDSVWHRHRHWTKNVLTELPSFYMERNVYGSFIHDRIGVANRHLKGAKNIMWSTDYPHAETSFPNSMQALAQTFEGVPEAEVEQIVCTRARELYHLA